MGDNWLYDFCNILNEKKHNTLTPQKRQEKKGLTIDFGGSKIKMSPGCSIRGSGSIGTGQNRIILNNDTISGDSPAQRISGNVQQTIVTWVSFVFSNTDTNVLLLLKKVLNEIEDLQNKIYQKL